MIKLHRNVFEWPVCINDMCTPGEDISRVFCLGLVAKISTKLTHSCYGRNLIMYIETQKEGGAEKCVCWRGGGQEQKC